MLAVDPPLPRQRQILLKVVEQVSTGHGASREEMRAHPSFFKFVRSRLVAENVHEKFSSGLQRSEDFGH